MSQQLPRFIFVLGMHRSGTSCLTGALESCGLMLNNVNRTHKDNQRGNLENAKVQRINDRILGHNQGRWHDPPDSVEVTEEHKKWIHEYLESVGSLRPIGIKDPRITLFGDVWFSSAKSFQLVGTFRHPMAVALSLEKRNSFPIEKSLRLWAHYNEYILKLRSKYNFPLVEYDLNTYEHYCEKIGTLAALIGLTKDIEGVKKFVSRELQNARPVSDEVPAQYEELYSNLKAVAL